MAATPKVTAADIARIVDAFEEPVALACGVLRVAETKGFDAPPTSAQLSSMASHAAVLSALISRLVFELHLVLDRQELVRQLRAEQGKTGANEGA